MVQGTSEIQKRVREIILKCPNAINIKDHIIVHGLDEEHDQHLDKTFASLQKRNITLRRAKCFLS